jgi:hypothetical protein
MRIAAFASITVLTAIWFAPARADAAEPDKPADKPAVVTGEDEHEGDPSEAPKPKSKKSKKAKSKDRAAMTRLVTFARRSTGTRSRLASIWGPSPGATACSART